MLVVVEVRGCGWFWVEDARVDPVVSVVLRVGARGCWGCRSGAIGDHGC